MKPAERVVAVVALLVAGACASATGAPNPPAPLPAALAGIQGQPHEQFLSSARVVRVVDIGEGVTRPRRVTLEAGGVVHDAAFKWIDEHRQGITTLNDGTVDTDFWDSWQAEVAAYRIDRLIGLGMVPATVERPVRGNRGSLMWWATAMMSEEDRINQRLQPPDAELWSRQTQAAHLFDELIANVDRHMNNLLVTEDFDLLLIDHSRAFRTNQELRDPDRLTRFSRTLLDGLRSLTAERLKTEVGRYLSGARIERVIARRDAILALVERRIAERGEAAVLYR